MSTIIKNFRLPVVNFRLAAFLIAVIILWSVSILTNEAAEVVVSTDTSPWLSPALRTIAFLSNVLLIGLLLAGLWSIGVKIFAAIAPGLLSTGAVDINLEPAEEFEGAAATKQTLTGLAKTLVEIETDSSKATLLLLDADQQVTALVGLIKAIALKAEAMRTEAEGLQSAMEAISSRDPIRIARAAGQIKDRQIQGLMLCEVKTTDYWSSVARLTATQLGTLEQWSAGYDQFAANLLSEVSHIKTRLGALIASLELAGTARPFLQIQSSLDEAQQYLQLQRRSELRQALKALPAINVGLLNRGGDAG